MCSRDGEHVRGGRDRADQVDEERRPASVEPSGSPRTARRWFSNWLVAAPSIDQWRRRGRAARTRSRAGGRRRRRARARARRRTRERRAAPGVLLCLRLRGVRGRCTRRPQDPALVDVLDERVEARVAVDRTDGDQRQLAVERDTFLEDMTGSSPPMSRRDAVPCRRSRGAASSGSLESPRPRRRASASDPEPAEELLLDEPVLRGLERGGSGDRPDPLGRPDRDVSNSYVTAAAPLRAVEELRSSYSPTSSSPTSAAGASARDRGSEKRARAGSPPARASALAGLPR